MKKLFFIGGLLLSFLACTEEQKNTRVVQVFTDGSTKTECDYTPDGLEKIYQRTYFEGGAMQYEGPILRDKREGEWKFYHRDGWLKNLKNYKEGEYHGNFIEYNKKGEVVVEGQYENGKRVGDWSNTGAATTTDVEETVKSTTQVTETYPDGSKKLEVTYESELPVFEKHWYQSGELLMEGSLQANQRHGVWKSYFKNGKIQSLNNFFEGLNHGDYILYKENGGVLIEGEYDMSKQTGQWNSYDQEGNLINTKYYDQEGTLIEEINHES